MSTQRWLVAILAVSLLLGTIPDVQAQRAPIALRVVFPGTSEPERAYSLRLKEVAERRFPDIRVEMMYIGWPELERKLAVMLPGGDIPDIVMQQEATTLVGMKALEPLDDYLRQSTRLRRDAFFGGVWNFSVYDGRLYTIPILAIGYGLVVREDLLNATGFKLSDLATWEDLKRAARAMTRGEVYGYGYPLGLPRFAWREGPYIAGYSNNVDISDTSEAAKPRYLEVLRLFRELKPFMPPNAKVMGLRDAFQAYALGTIGMMPSGSFFVANVYPMNPKILAHTRAIPYPRGPSARAPWAPVANAGWAIFAASRNKAAAWRVLEEWTTPENLTEQVALINLPPRNDLDITRVAVRAASFYPEAAVDNRRILNDFVAAIDAYGRPMGKINRREEIEVVFQQVMIRLLDGELTPEAAYDRIKAEIDRIKAGR